MSEAGNSLRFKGYFDTAIKACLLLLVFAGPLSIAATQIAWSFALLFWLLRLIVYRPRLRHDKLEIAMFVFLGLTVVSSIFSFEQVISIRKLVPVGLVSIAYLIAEQAKDEKFRRRAVTLLLIGCFVSVLGTLFFLVRGQNLKIIAMTPDSPLRAAGVIEGDTLWRIDRQGINTPADLQTVNAKHPGGFDAEMTWYRHELVITQMVRVGDYNGGPSDLGLGVTEWQKGRDTRASGFYGHYVTYSEMLQLVTSLAIGLFLAFYGGLTRERIALAVAILGYGVAMFLTITRASWAGLLGSTAVMVLIGRSKKTVLIAAALAIPLAIGGVWYLQQKRQVGVVDTSDGSTQWRLIVWQEAGNIIVSSPRNMLVGVGMDSVTKRWPEWHMFQNGQIPLGHMHSDYIELAFERGIPTLIAWLAWMAIYLTMLWRGYRGGDFGWPERGILLGALGGTVGFLLAGFVHYNWGDSEVAMTFYMIMGLALATLRSKAEASREEAL
ncbi:MAG: O-antigen ligase family protein [Pyrinomonadaceae bacterium]